MSGCQSIRSFVGAFTLVSLESTLLALAVWVSAGTGTGVFVGDGWAVSVLVGFVVHNLLAAIGQQDVVTANGAVSIARFHVSEIVARLEVLNLVLEAVLGGFGVGIGIGIVVTGGTASSSTRWGSVLGGWGRWIAVVVCVIVVTVIPIALLVVAVWRRWLSGDQGGQRDESDDGEDLHDCYWFLFLARTLEKNTLVVATVDDVDGGVW